MPLSTLLAAGADQTMLINGRPVLMDWAAAAVVMGPALVVLALGLGATVVRLLVQFELPPYQRGCSVGEAASGDETSLGLVVYSFQLVVGSVVGLLVLLAWVALWPELNTIHPAMLPGTVLAVIASTYLFHVEAVQCLLVRPIVWLWPRGALKVLEWTEGRVGGWWRLAFFRFAHRHLRHRRPQLGGELLALAGFHQTDFPLDAQLDEAGGEELKGLLEALNDRQRQQVVCQLLEERGDDEVIHALKEAWLEPLLGDERSEVRTRALRAFGRLQAGRVS